MADTEPAVPAFKKRGNKASAMRKRPAPPPSDKDSSSSGSDTTDDETGTRIKRRKREGVQTSTKTTNNASRDFSKSTKFNADRNASITANDNATKASTWYTDAALKGSSTDKTASKTPATEDAQQANEDGTYKGSAAYGSFIQKNPDKNNKHVGPVKAPTNVRAITVTDFAPDVCKDYKQTGFCGFGDSCKFLHAREDYKQGWQLDKEWEKAGKKGAAASGGPAGKDQDLDDEEKMLLEIPFKCVLCKGDYKMPVVTKCGHYFCEKCAMQRYMKEKKKGCAQCGADTYGSFGVARKLKDLLEKKTRREKERTEKEDEEAAAAEG